MFCPFEELRKLARTDASEEVPHAGDCHGLDDGGDDQDGSASNTSSLSFDALSSNDSSGPGRNPRLTLQAHIEDTIDRLYGHALQIEAAGANHRRKRVELYRQNPEVQAAYDGFRALALHVAKLKFKKASQPFLGRLAESFARRRIRLDYLDRHQKKRAIDTQRLVQVEDPTPAPEPQRNNPDRHDQPPGAAAEKSPLDLKRASGASSRLQDERTAYSGTVETKLDPGPPQKRPEKAESVASVVLRKDDFPPPPPCPDGVSFQCPYCRLEFRAHEAKMVHWRYVLAPCTYVPPYLSSLYKVARGTSESS